MKVSEAWLKTLLDLPLPLESLASQLTNAGIEVDSIETENSVLTLKIPANRGDCLGMEGVARELAVLNVLPFKGIKINPCLPKVTETFPIQIEAKEACPRYVARVIQNVDPNVETPTWMRKRLEDAGLRSISAIVDIGNYVMLELGQPLHAFDLSQVKEGIQVRFAKEHEKITTLDSKVVILDKDTLVIADKDKALAIAGIMGGLESSVNSSTRKIILESAYFEPKQIRSAAKRLYVRTESSLRFERGIDPNLQIPALERATELLLEIVGGNAGPLIEQVQAQFLPQAPKIFLRLAKVKDVLGICPEDEIRDILTRLGMKLTGNNSNAGFEVVPPSFRGDILREVDLIEEIARIYGYDRIPSHNPLVPLEFLPIPEDKLGLNQIKHVLINKGYNEAITYSFLAADFLQIVAPSLSPITISNPISEELAVMRNSLWPGLLKAVQYNQRRSQNRIKLFETGLCFNKAAASLLQQERIAGVAVGSVLPEQWGSKNQPLDFYDIKNDVEALLALTRRHDFNFTATEHEMLHPGQAAKITLAEQDFGLVGALHPRLIQELEIQGPLFLFELDLLKLSQALIPKFQELSKFPVIRRDIAIIVDKSVLAEELKSAIVACVGSLARNCVIFDVYQGKGIEPGRKSVAIGLILQHSTRTLVESEVNDLMQKLMQTLAKQFKATLRE